MLTSNKIVCTSCYTEHVSEFAIQESDRRLFKGSCTNCGKPIKFKLNEKGLKERDSITFFVNGTPHTINNEYPLKLTLNAYLRDFLFMTGTKVMCREGGCGACIVNAEIYDFNTKSTKNVAVNSCLVPLYACDGIKFTTVEGIGSKAKGFSEIQKRLADNNGSQCGWCSTGMVMNMYSLLLNTPQPTKDQIEKNFDGNICRCTGYRPILDAMKSFAIGDRPVVEIEELNKISCLSKLSNCSLNDHGHGHAGCANQCSKEEREKCQKRVHIISEQDAAEWFSPKSMDDLYALLVQYKQLSAYKLICGNTGIGVYKVDKYADSIKAYINIKNVDELYAIDDSGISSLSFGAALSLNNLIDLFNSYATKKAGFEYLAVLAKHFARIANVGVRNMGSMAGNLMLKYFHNDFISDVFVCLEAVGALITLVGPDKFTPSIQVSPAQFLATNLDGKCIYSVSFPAYDKTKTFIKTFKTMPRSQNAHAYVNAGFRMDVDASSMTVTQTPTLVFGGISGAFVHATKTEAFLSGKKLTDPAVLNQAFATLAGEINPDSDPVLASPDYRRSLAVSLFYKFVLAVCDAYVGPRYKSAEDVLIDTRDISHGQQFYPTNPSTYPVSKGMTKLNAYLQASGEAEYVFDMPAVPNQLYGAFVLAQQANCQLDKIDDSAALSLPGVVKILYAKDIPGQNTFMPPPTLPEKLFSDGPVDYAGQAVGLVLAETYETARNAAKLVNMTYKQVQTPILTIADAIKAGSYFPKPSDDFSVGDAKTAVKNAPVLVTGDVSLDSQFHIYMENQVSICKPNEDGYEVWSSTQWLDLVQNGIAMALGLKKSSAIDVKTKQLGGAYGGKITRSNMVAVASAVGCYATARPVRVALDLQTDLELIGKRFPWYAKYQIGVSEDGLLQGIIIDLYVNAGNSPNDSAIMAGPQFLDNTYSCKNWLISFNVCKTNLPANTACRSPGTFPSICIIECMMEQVAKQLNLDSLAVRMKNMYKKGDVSPGGQPLPYFNVPDIINGLVTSSDYNKRVADVSDFNQKNRWKKRGLSITPIKWGVGWNGGYYNALMSIYNLDGSIAVSHGGIEVGQGIHTKVAQVAAYELGVPLELISVKHANNLTNPNAQCTGGSITSELVCQAIINCCKILNDRLDPVRKQMPSGYTWKDLIAKAFSLGVDLFAHYWIYPNTPNPFAYNVYGAACSEVIIDVLSGETELLRTDILYDGGQSINGVIDIGQAEGAFMMGVGFWLFEKIKYDPATGKCLTNGTWEYKPPTTRDIPVDLRITFMDNNPNPLGVLGSKAVGEPPLCLTPSVALAVKRAIEAARSDAGRTDFFPINSPTTVDLVQQLCLVDYSQFKLSD